MKKSLLVYTLSGFFTSGIPFLLLPIMTKYLSQEDYGTLALFSSTILIFSILISSGIPSILSVDFFKESHSMYSLTFSSGLYTILFATIFHTTLFYLFKDQIVFFKSHTWETLSLIPLVAFFSIIVQIAKTQMRNMQNPIQFSFFSLSTSVVELLLSIIFVTVFILSWKGRLLGSAIAFFIFTIVSFYLFNKWGLIKLRFDVQQSARLFLLGAPLIPERLSAFTLNASDKFFIAKMATMADVGVYTVATQLGSIILIIINAFYAAYSPELFKILAENKQKQRIKKHIMLFVVFMLLLILVTSFLAPVIFNHFIGNGYEGGGKYIFWILLGYFFWGVSVIFKPILLFHKQTMTLMSVSLISIIVNLFLNYVLIDSFGVMGAAYATTASYALLCMMVICFAMSKENILWSSSTK